MWFAVSIGLAVVVVCLATMWGTTAATLRRERRRYDTLTDQHRADIRRLSLLLKCDNAKDLAVLEAAEAPSVFNGRRVGNGPVEAKIVKARRERRIMNILSTGGES